MSERPLRTPRRRPKTSASPKATKANVASMPVSTKRARVSDFATKRPSGKKRRRQSTRDVDDLLRGVKELIRAEDSEKAKGLKDALMRADEMFKTDVSDGESSEEDKEVQDKSTKKEPSSQKKDKNLMKTPDAEKKQKATPKQSKRKAKTPETRRELFKTPKSVKTKGKDGSKKSTVSKTASAHKRDIEALKKDDPQFYKFLQENDAELLDFDLDEDLVGSSEEDSDASAEEGSDEQTASQPTNKVSHDSDSDEEDSDDEKPVTKSAKKSTPKHSKSAPTYSVHESSEEESTDEQDSEPERKTRVMPTKGKSSVKKAQTPKDEVIDDKTGYSDDSEDDDEEEQARAEEEAAAEAGIVISDRQTKKSRLTRTVDGESSDEPNSDDEDDEEEDSGDEATETKVVSADEMDVDTEDDDKSSREQSPVKKNKNNKLLFVDSAYLRKLREQISAKRKCLQASKDLLRLFRAGRGILPSQSSVPNKKSKKSKRGKPSDENDDEDIDEDEFHDDGSFTSGKVKFASANVYQQAMNLAITGIQEALDHMLARPVSKKGVSDAQIRNWDPTSSSRWPNIERIFRTYVYHMLALCDGMSDPATLRFLLKRLERLVPYTRDNAILLKKIIRIAIRVWSSDSKHMSQATKLRAYLLLNRLAHGQGNAEAVLRSCCSVFSSRIANMCNTKTLPQIQFSIMCIVELFGIDMGASYTTAFSSLREMAVSLRTVLVSKDLAEVERIHNWSYVNNFRLWSAVIGRYGTENELHPLIYPYVQVALGVMRARVTPKTYPMHLHIASFLSDLISTTGTFIPIPPHLLLLLRLSELKKKPARGKTKALEWRSLLRVSEEDIKSKPYLSGIVYGVVLQLARFFSIISKHVSFPEIAHATQVALKRFSKEVKVPEWRAKVLLLVEKLKQTSEMIATARAKADFSPNGAVSAEGMLGVVPGLDLEKKTPITRFYEVELDRVKRDEKLRDEKSGDKSIESAEGDESKDKNVRKNRMVRFEESDEDESESDSEEVVEKRKRTRKQNKKTVKPSLMVPIMGDEDEDIVQELSLDSSDDEEDN